MARTKRPAGTKAATKSTPSRARGALKILVVDDQKLVREGLRYILKRLGDNVQIQEADSFEEARKLIRGRTAFGLVLADPYIGGGDGYAGLAELASKLPNAPVVAISQVEARGEIRRAFDEGLRGYIPKSSNSDIMLAALSLVLAGGTYLPPSLLADLPTRPVGRGYAERRQEPLTGLLSRLTPRQLDVLAELGMGKSNRDIARDLDLAEGTVKVHVTAILKALGVKNRTQAVIAGAELTGVGKDR